MRQKMKQLMGILLSLVLILGLMPGMSLTAYADETIYNPASEYTDYGTLETKNTTVKIEGVQYNNANVDWYVIGYDRAAKTVTLLSKQPFGKSQFNNAGGGNKYEGSVVKGYVEGLTGAGKPLAGIKDALANVSVTDPSVTGKVPYLLNISEADELSGTKKKGEGNDWWLRSPGNRDLKAAFVIGEYSTVGGFGSDVEKQYGVRPALKLNLSSVIFSSESNTFSLKPYSVNLTGGANAATSGGATSQTGVTGAMTTVTYTANSGYIFPETSDLYKTTNGITVVRTSDTVVTVSGKPTANVTITIPDAEAKFTVAKGAPVNLPKTGDSSNVFVHVLIGLIALSGLGLVIKKR